MSERFEDSETNKSGAAACTGPAPSRTGKSAGAKLIAFAALAIAWIVLDQLVKRQIEGVFSVSAAAAPEPIVGLFRLHLVYNTGGAWSIFSGSTAALGVFSLVMCVAITVYVIVQRRRLSWLEVIGLALVVAGGLGNAIDRFALGHVVDFIDLTFMDFPVFNIADIGVTCGLVVFLIAWLIRGHREDAAIENSTADGKAVR